MVIKQMCVRQEDVMKSKIPCSNGMYWKRFKSPLKQASVVSVSTTHGVSDVIWK